MKRTTKIMMTLAVVGGMTIWGMGCANNQSSLCDSGECPSASECDQAASEHPNAEHPKAEHPEHPKSEHPEHPNSDHPDHPKS